MTVRRSTDPRFDDDNIGWFWALSAVGIAILISVAMAFSSPDCSSPTDRHARRSCYGAVARPHPAKGAAVPELVWEKKS
jgi:hypothetical protein